MQINLILQKVESTDHLFCNIIHQSVFMLFLCLSLYIIQLYQYCLMQYFLLGFRIVGFRKSGFDSGFPYELSFPALYKVLYVNSFHNLYYYQHYDSCLVNIVILYYMKTWILYNIKKYIFCVCLFVRMIADSE